MRLRIPRAAKALVVLTAAGLLLGGCYYHPRAYHGGPHYAAPSHGHHYHGKGKQHGHGHHADHHGHRSHWEAALATEAPHSLRPTSTWPTGGRGRWREGGGGQGQGRD